MVSVPHSFYSHVFVDHVAAECLCFQQPTPAAPEACFPQRPRKPEVPIILHPPLVASNQRQADVGPRKLQISSHRLRQF